MPELDRIESEESLIATYLAPLAAQMPGAFGLGDDCAALAPAPGQDLVLTTDAVAEGVHFLPHDRPEDIAWKALAVNLSDLAGKAAKPVAYLLSLAFPEAPARTWMAAFADGLRQAQEQFAIGLLGGDTDRRSGVPLSVTVMALGTVPAGRMVRRSAAQPGDFVYVSGTLGDAALGLRLHRGEPGSGAEGDGWLVARYLRPQPRTGLRDALLAHAHAGMDVSDGLVKDLGRLCRAAHLSARIELQSLPVSDPARSLIARRPELEELILTGGDDYEVLACVPPSRAAAFEELAAAGGTAVTRIGRLDAGSGVAVLDAAGAPVRLARAGYDHFAAPGT
jgi:thiamine-monophosphate kinase